jgi:peptidoglycan hydrolase-like protein with peptidoglycan-binding domain
MNYSLTWLPGVLYNAGLKVAPVPGWESRGLGDAGTVRGVICHATIGARMGNMPSLRTLIDGRPGTHDQAGLSGPLSQLGLGRDGTYYIVAAGRCQHAGRGEWQGVQNGNTHFIGIEAENAGIDDPWPDIQMQAYRHGVAAILSHLGLSSLWVAGHKEYATPLGRKSDPDFDMHEFRVSVEKIMAGAAPPLPLIPAAETANGSSTPPRPTLLRGATGDLVKFVQQKLDVPVDGGFGPHTEAAVRSFQRNANVLPKLVPDGRVGPNTWRALDAVP